MPDFKLLVQPSAFHHPDLSPHRAQSPHGQTWPQSERNTEVFLRKTVRPLAAVQTQDTGAVLTERQGAKLKVKLIQSCLTLRHHGLSMEFSRPEYWSGQPFPSPGNLPNPAIEPRSPALQADSLPAEPQGKPKNTGVGEPFPSPVDLPHPGPKLGSPALQVDSLPAELSGDSTNTGRLPFTGSSERQGLSEK